MGSSFEGDVCWRRMGHFGLNEAWLASYSSLQTLASATRQPVRHLPVAPYSIVLHFDGCAGVSWGLAWPCPSFVWWILTVVVVGFWQLNGINCSSHEHTRTFFSKLTQFIGNDDDILFY